jgi:CRP-like cAMP-binding protein
MDLEHETTARSRGGRLNWRLLRAQRQFEAVSDSELRGLAGFSVWRDYRRQEYIAAAEGAGQDVFLLVRGVAGAGAAYAPGEVRILFVLTAGDAFDLGGLGVLVGGPTYVIALSKVVRVYRFLASKFRLLVDSRSAIERSVEDCRSRCAQDMAHFLIDDLSYDAQTRLGRLLGRLALRTGSADLDFTHEELAMMGRFRRAQVTELLPALRSHGRISYESHRHGIHVASPEQLAVMESILADVQKTT